MSAQTLAQPHGNLLFHWERPRRRKLAIAGFFLASLGLHAVCFYLFQVIYPPAISLLPPPARIAIIAPTSDDARTFLSWLDAEDPALASQTLRPPEARALQLPKLAHVPSYISSPPKLKPAPSQPVRNLQVSAMPPGIVPKSRPQNIPTPAAIPSSVTLDDSLGEALVRQPSLGFHTTARDTPQRAIFRLGIDRDGTVRYALLAHSSGDSDLDEQARAALNLFRFDSARLTVLPNEKLKWSRAEVDFGNDLAPTTPTPAP